MTNIPAIGSSVIANKPIVGTPFSSQWIPGMDKYDGKVGIVRDKRSEDTVYVSFGDYHLFYYYLFWLEPCGVNKEPDFDETRGDF